MSNRTTMIAVLTAMLVVGSAIAVIGAAESSDAADNQVFYTYTLTFRFSGSGATPENVVWNFGDGSPEVTGYIVEHTFKKGDFVITQTATNDIGSSVKIKNITIMGYPVVTFETDGGSKIDPVEVPVIDKKFQPVKQPDDPTKVGYTFTGWYADQLCEVPWDFSDAVEKHTTLYAGWFKGIVTKEIPSTEEIQTTLDAIKTLEYYIPSESLDDPTKNVTLSKDLFESLDKDEKIYVHFYDSSDEDKKVLVTWTIDGSSVFNEDCIDEMDLGVKSQNKPFTPDQEKAAKDQGANSGYYVDFSASGELPYNMYVTVYVGDLYKTGDVLMLYLYDNGSMISQYKEAVVDESGYVTTDIDHCSVYAFLSFADTSQGSIDTTTIIVIAIFGVLIAAIIGYRYFVGKKEA